MRLRTRSYAAAFAGVALTGLSVSISISMQQPVAEALRSSSSPLFSSPRTRTDTNENDANTSPSTIRTERNPRYSNSPCCHASRTDTDTGTETDRDTIHIRRKSYGAPVVDSNLLRFMSEQKAMPDVFRDAVVLEEEEDAINVPTSTSSDSRQQEHQYQKQELPMTRTSVSEYPSESIGNDRNGFVSDYASTTDAIKNKLTGRHSMQNDDEFDVQPLDDFVLTNTLANIEASSSSSSTSWMAQFGTKNVAQFLLANGDVTDEASARTAGDAVERYCVVRTARLRIRRFLKERDTLWATGSSAPGTSSSSSSRSELEAMAASDMATSPAASLLLSYAEQRERQRRSTSHEDGDDAEDGLESTPSYGFEDVLEVMRDYGLTGNDLCVLLTHSPNLALRVPRKSFLREGQTDEAETLEETLERSLKGLLMSTLGLRRYDARKVLRTCPGLLSVRGSESAVQVVTIMTKLGVSESSLARDKNSLPVLLSRSPAGLFRLVAFLSSAAVRMPLEQIGPLLRRRVGRELMDALLPVPNTSYSKVLANANNGNANVNTVTIAAANATTTTYTDIAAQEVSKDSSEDATTLEDDAAAWSNTRIERQERIERTYAGMTQTAGILRAQIGTQDLSKVVAAYPNVLLLDAEKQILPVARYLMGGLGIWQNDLSGVLQLYPTLLGTKIEDLERVVSYVLTLGVDEDDLAGIFRAFPGLFALPIEDMEAVVDYLRSIDVLDVGAFVTKLPPVLGYSVEEELKPKWEFLKTVCLQPEFELKEFPAYFSYPFRRVINARFSYLAYKGISIRFVSMRIDTVLRFGDIDFAKKIALDDDEGQAFFSFSSQRGRRKANATAQKLKRKKRDPRNTNAYANNNNKNANPPKNSLTARNNSNNANRSLQNQNEAGAALASAQRLSEEIDNATNLAEINRCFREAAPLRNRSLGDSLPSLSPIRPKRKHKTKQNQQQSNNKDQGGGEEGVFPCPA